MSPSKAADLKKISAWAEDTIALSSDHKAEKVDQTMRDLVSFVKALLRKKKCEIGIVVVSDPLQ